MSYIIEITNCFIEVAIYLFFLSRILTPKKMPLGARAGILTVTMLIHIFRSFYIKTTYPNYLITILLFTCMAILLYKDSVVKRLGSFFLYFFAHRRICSLVLYLARINTYTNLCHVIC